MNLKHYSRAGFPCVAVETIEEERFIRNVLTIDAHIYSIAAIGGLVDVSDHAVIDGKMQYGQAFGWLQEQRDAILIVNDLQHILKNAGVYRSLKMSFDRCKDNGSMIILVAPSWSLPPELAHDVPVLQFDLPSRKQLRIALERVIEGAQLPEVTDDILIESLLDAAAGLSLQEAENAFALALVEKKALDPATVEREKMRLVKSSGYLEVSQPMPIDSLGGLDNLKGYFRREVVPSMHDDVLRVKGILLVGVAGTGKSLGAKVAGSILGWPVLRMDVGSLKGSLVGQSESNMRAALKQVDAIAPAILWMDEIEKGVGGHASSASSDGGTTLGMIGQLLTWLQEHTSPVITIATCNDYAKLPTELTRAGRFDERFFVDLPCRSERVEIARVHLKRYAGQGNGLAEKAADVSDAWTGAEIEQLVKSSARRTGRAITADSLTECARDIRPISRVKADEIKALREWAKDTLRMANTVDLKPVADMGRKVVVNGV
jgi:hypothetical protein